MVEKAIQSNPHFRVELIEMEREGPSYTVDTVELLKKRHPEDEFFYDWSGHGRVFAEMAQNR